ncbi:MAG TPA: type 3 dihydrofolate reductase [Gammaproteobacteria bacterium]|nr:type 3 dihydrofolate reductase [Gammaproteobacteria bacterium]
MPFIAAIAAMAENRVIGKNNQLPWRLPADLKHFKALTLNHAVIMGRKTYDSIGKPLPQRLNIILSREKTLLIPGCTVTHDIEAAIAAAASASDIFVIGGTQIYELFLPRIKRIYLTTIHHTFDGDQYFPALPENQWKAISHEYHAADADNAYNYTFSVLEAV